MRRPWSRSSAQPRGDFVVAGHDHPGVAVGAEILARIEAEAGGIAEGSDPPAAVARSVRLRRVFDEPQAVAAGDVRQGDACRPASRRDGPE